jgi:aryl-alcohol dehydrogenase-like predicted oxidoreductase
VSRSTDNDLAEALFRERMSLLAYSPLAGGMLSGKYLRDAKPAESRFIKYDNFALRFRKPTVRTAVEAFAEVAQRHGISMVQLALGYVRSRWHVGATIVGATSLKQLEEDIDAAQFDLDQATLDDIAAVHLRFPNPAA